jgi:DNA-binding MurR/RpiR family transcriptional regulator
MSDDNVRASTLSKPPNGERTAHMRLLTAELTGAEARVARLLMSDYPQSALAKAVTLAQAAATSQSTVTRLVAKLGYANYPAFQEEVRSELRSRLASPGVRLRAQGPKARRTASDYLSESIQADVENLQRTAELLDRAAFERLVARLVAPRGGAYVIGSKKAGPIAENLALQLRQLRPNVHMLSLGDNLPDQLLGMNGDDVVIVVEPRRATTLMETAMSCFRQRGATIAVLCDEVPIPSLASNPIVLTASTHGTSMFDSYSSIVSVCNALLAAVAGGLRSSAVVERIDELEAINTQFGMWTEPNPLSATAEGDSWRTS